MGRRSALRSTASLRNSLFRSARYRRLDSEDSDDSDDSDDSEDSDDSDDSVY